MRSELVLTLEIPIHNMTYVYDIYMVYDKENAIFEMHRHYLTIGNT